MPQEIAVIAVAEAKPGHEAEAQAAIRPCIEGTRRETDCHLYTVHTDVEHPGRFVFIERWASREALSQHEKEPHFQAMAKALEPLLKGPFQVQILRELA